jgi:hypothetical protein
MLAFLTSFNGYFGYFPVLQLLRSMQYDTCVQVLLVPVVPLLLQVDSTGFVRVSLCTPLLPVVYCFVLLNFVVHLYRTLSLGTSLSTSLSREKLSLLQYSLEQRERERLRLIRAYLYDSTWRNSTGNTWTCTWGHLWTKLWSVVYDL